jgi:hypothetical protein
MKKEMVMYRHLSCRVLLCVLLSLIGCTESFNRSEQLETVPGSTMQVDLTTRAYPLLTVEEGYNGALHVDSITNAAHVRVRSPDMAAGDTLKVFWPGAVSQSTAVQTATGSTPLVFELPVAWLQANVGRTVDLYYTYKINGVGESLRSAPLPVHVVESDSVFSVDGVVDNKLNLSAVGATATVRVRYPGMGNQDTVQVYWGGIHSHSTIIQTAAGTAPLDFELPKAWLQESQDTTVALYYTYKVGGVGTTVRSENINVSIVSETIEQGRLVAEALNRRYNDTRNDCHGKAAYFCNGVFMRTTGANTRYHAWDPSPTSISIGGISFSYLRQDVGIQRFAYDETQGLIFKNNAASAQDGQLDVKVLCSYPSDAATAFRTTEKGCGPHPLFSSNSGACAAQTPPVDTIERWKSHYNAVGGSGGFSGRNRHQCSFGADPVAFALSLAVRDHFLVPSQERPLHNELMLETWPTGTTTALPLEAVFYLTQQTREVGLAGAQFIQRDYFDVTGHVIPLIQVNLNKTSPYSFNISEQAVTPPAPEIHPAITSVRDSSKELGEGSTTTDTVVSVAGAAMAAQSVELFDGQDSKGVVPVDSNGEWTASVMGLAIGTHSITAKASYGSGLVSTQRTFTIWVDAKPTIDRVQDSQGEVSNGGTVDTHLTVSGTASANQMVALFDGQTALGTAVVNTAGAWTFDLTGLTIGAHSVTAKANYGSSQVSAPRTFRTLTEAIPVIASVRDSHGEVSNDGTTSDTSVLIAGIASAGQVVEVFDGQTSKGRATAGNGGAWILNLNGLITGPHSLTAKALYGNGLVSAPRTFTVLAGTRPVIVSVQDSQGEVTQGGSTFDTRVTLSGTAVGTQMVMIYDAQTSKGLAIVNANGGWSLGLTGLTPGPHSLTAKALQGTGEVSLPRTFTITPR